MATYWSLFINFSGGIGIYIYNGKCEPFSSMKILRYRSKFNEILQIKRRKPPKNIKKKTGFSESNLTNA
jgi:hypothetical protein